MLFCQINILFHTLTGVNGYYWRVPGNEVVDNVCVVLLSTSMFVGGITGFFFDNTIPGEYQIATVTGLDVIAVTMRLLCIYLMH